MQPMRRESPYPMVPFAEAQRIIAEHTPLLPTEEISALTAEGRVLAEDVYSDDPVPDVAKSAVDGYALLAADGLAERRVLAEVTAGAGEQSPLAPGTAVRIMTGAPVPPGADAVVPWEDTEPRPDEVAILAEIPTRKHVRPRGEDLKAVVRLAADREDLGPPLLEWLREWLPGQP